MEIDLSFAGTRVFIVEDEALILDTLQDMLEDLGCEVVESATRVGEALAKAPALAFDVAVLDVNVAGERVDPVADLLANRGVPFLFATGYGRSSLAAAHRERVVLAKPYRKSDLKVALAAVLSR
jgi:CheY-like chemotaxis protein